MAIAIHLSLALTALILGAGIFAAAIPDRVVGGFIWRLIALGGR